MDVFAITGIINQSPWQLDFPYLHTVMALPERHTDVSIRGLSEISSNTKVWMHNINFSHIFYLNTLHT